MSSNSTLAIKLMIAAFATVKADKYKTLVVLIPAGASTCASANAGSIEGDTGILPRVRVKKMFFMVNDLVI
jgi:hypothetical protein